MENGVERTPANGDGAARPWAKDALGAIALAEGAIAQRVFVLDSLAGSRFRLEERNAFKSAVVVERGPDVATLVRKHRDALAGGERSTLIATAGALSQARSELRAIAGARLGGVVHALCERMNADVMALADLGWGLLFASGVEDSLDLTLVARRASEDSGAPFMVVHPRPRPGARHIEPVSAPTVDLCEVFVGPPQTRVRRVDDPAHPMHADVAERAFAERVPFALGSAMRELESLTGRRHDVLERIPAGEAQVVLLALGDVGDSLVGAVERLRAAGLDVGAVRLTALRPFPGARLVKVLSRALAVTVVECVDEPLAQSNPLTRELKAAFADALTWAPDYPGIGRIPRVLSGVAHLGDHEMSVHDIDAIVHNMLADEHGKRSFVLGSDPSLALPEVPLAEAKPAHNGRGDAASVLRQRVSPQQAFSMRGRVKDAQTAEACSELVGSVLASALGLRVRGAVRQLPSSEGDGYAFDLHAGRERPRGSHPPHAVRLVAVDDASVLIRGNPIMRLGHGGLLAIPTQQRSADALWSDLPPYVKAIAFDRSARVVGWTPPSNDDPEAAGHASWFTAAAFAGIALAGAAGGSAIDPSLVAREVENAMLVAVGPDEASAARRGGEIAREIFAASVEVPRAVVERDEEAIRLGRRDARAAATR